jgi:hypothetical protein
VGEGAMEQNDRDIAVGVIEIGRSLFIAHRCLGPAIGETRADDQTHLCESFAEVHSGYLREFFVDLGCGYSLLIGLWIFSLKK